MLGGKHTGKVVPHIGNPVNVPLGLTTNKPSKVVVWGSGWVSIDPAILHLSEVGLEEVDLMLIVWVWRVGRASPHAEVVEKSSSSQVRGSLGDQLRPPHVRVPQSGGVHGDLDTLLAGSICRVLV